VIPEKAQELAREVFSKADRPDWITFTSSSTVKNLLAVTEPGALQGIRLASIGRITTKTAEMHGLKVDAEAQVASVDGLVQAILSARNSS
jgi:uroporphyrinogen III methyltransferase/synthase